LNENTALGCATIKAAQSTFAHVREKRRPRKDPESAGFLDSTYTLLRFPISSLPIAPYLLVCTGGTIAVFGGSDTYTLIYVGMLIELRSGIHVRPDFRRLSLQHMFGAVQVRSGEHHLKSKTTKQNVAHIFQTRLLF
jgi:hypothetical protein